MKPGSLPDVLASAALLAAAIVAPVALYLGGWL